MVFLRKHSTNCKNFLSSNREALYYSLFFLLITLSLLTVLYLLFMECFPALFSYLEDSTVVYPTEIIPVKIPYSRLLSDNYIFYKYHQFQEVNGLPYIYVTAPNYFTVRIA